MNFLRMNQSNSDQSAKEVPESVDVKKELKFANFVWPKPATVLKKGPWHRCFPVNFANILRTSFLQNTFGRLLLQSAREVAEFLDARQYGDKFLYTVVWNFLQLSLTNIRAKYLCTY